MVFSVITASTSTGSMLKLSGSMPTKTVVTPTWLIASAVGKERKRRRDDSVARTHAQRAQLGHERAGAGVDADRVPDAEILGHFFVESFYLGAKDELPPSVQPAPTELPGCTWQKCQTLVPAPTRQGASRHALS